MDRYRTRLSPPMSSALRCLCYLLSFRLSQTRRSFNVDRSSFINLPVRLGRLVGCRCSCRGEG